MIRYNFADGMSLEYPINISTFFWIATQIGFFPGPRGVTSKEYHREFRDGGYIYIYELPICKHIFETTHKTESHGEKQVVSIIIDNVFV